MSEDRTIAAEEVGAILNQALPYIQRFTGKVFVIKFGGSAMRSPETMQGFIRNVILLQLVGIRPVLVHGGGPEIDGWLEKLGIEKATVDGLRVTSDEAMKVVEMALAGRSNKALVAEVQHLGGRAIGLSGRDGNLLLAEMIRPELGRVGRVVAVQPDPIWMACDHGFVPIICSVAAGIDGGALNVNADTAAGAIAGAMDAEKLILMSDVPGVLRDVHDPESLVSSLSATESQALIQSGAVGTGMIPKLEAGMSALGDGVRQVHLIDGRQPNALLVELFTDKGIGTMLTRH